MNKEERKKILSRIFKRNKSCQILKTSKKLKQLKHFGVDGGDTVKSLEENVSYENNSSINKTNQYMRMVAFQINEELIIWENELGQISPLCRALNKLQRT